MQYGVTYTAAEHLAAEFFTAHRRSGEAAIHSKVAHDLGEAPALRGDYRVRPLHIGVIRNGIAALAPCCAHDEPRMLNLARRIDKAAGR